MESSDQWLQVEECGIMDSLCSSSPSMMERRVRPSPQDQALKCPRCESTHTKFCYYNNYSLSQPRYFCKACRRYWTKGGTLRNIPVGGGCRKNKKVSNKKSNVNDVVPFPQPHHDDHNLQLTTTSFPHHHHHHHQAMQIFSHPMGLMLDHPTPSEFMGTNVMNYGTTSRDLDGMGDHHVVDINGHTHNDGLLLAPNFQGFGGNFRSFDDSYNNISNNNNIISGTNYIMDSSSDANNIEDQHVAAIHDVKPNPKLLSLEWQDQGCSDAGKQPFGYIGGLGSWTGMINGYGSSTTNSFV